MGNRMLFHVPFRLGYAISGGGIRPGKMIQAFKDIGYSVDVISGPKKERLATIQMVMERIRHGLHYDFCYAESSVLPTMLTEKNQRAFYPFIDFEFFRLLKRIGVPVGLFYRDIFWKFKYYMNQFERLDKIRRFFFYHLELWFYKGTLDVLFLPSLKLSHYFPKVLARIASESPPGHDINDTIKRKPPKSKRDLRVLYVGGIIPPVYNIRPLLVLGQEIQVTICCRQEEWREYSTYYKDYLGKVLIRHISGDDLKEAYKEHNLAAILWAGHEYHSFAMPLKLIEAVGHSIPLIVSKGTNIARFIKNNHIGWTVDNQFRSLDLNAIIDTYQSKVDNLNSIRDSHHWQARAKHIRDTLISTKILQNNPVKIINI